MALAPVRCEGCNCLIARTLTGVLTGECRRCGRAYLMVGTGDVALNCGGALVRAAATSEPMPTWERREPMERTERTGEGRRQTTG